MLFGLGFFIWTRYGRREEPERQRLLEALESAILKEVALTEQQDAEEAARQKGTNALAHLAGAAVGGGGSGSGGSFGSYGGAASPMAGGGGGGGEGAAAGVNSRGGFGSFGAGSMERPGGLAASRGEERWGLSSGSAGGGGVGGGRY